MGGSGSAEPEPAAPAARAPATRGSRSGATAAAAARPGAVRTAHRAAVAYLPEPAARVRVRSGRGAQRGPQLSEGAAPGRFPDLPRGPVPVVAAGSGPVRGSAG